MHTFTITARARRGDTSTAVPCYGSGEVANEGLRHRDNRWAFPLGTRIHFFFVKLQHIHMCVGSRSHIYIYIYRRHIHIVFEKYR